MTNAFIRKLEYGAKLTDADRAQLAGVCTHSHRVAPRTDIIAEGDRPRDVHLVLEGFACRYKVLPDGKRQIMAWFVPGDICDLHVQILGEMDHNIATVSECTMVELSPDTVDELIANPRINRALWWATLVDEGTLREWLVNMGQRSSERQMAHIFCELLARLRSVGLALDDTIDLPFTQEELADSMGITAVHANRVLTSLRQAGLVELRGKRLHVPDRRALREYSGFDPNYLHLRDGHSGQADQREARPASA